jgi:hypothetical protein
MLYSWLETGGTYLKPSSEVTAEWHMLAMDILD